MSSDFDLWLCTDPMNARSPTTHSASSASSSLNHSSNIPSTSSIGVVIPETPSPVIVRKKNKHNIRKSDYFESDSNSETER